MSLKFETKIRIVYRTGYEGEGYYQIAQCVSNCEPCEHLWMIWPLTYNTLHGARQKILRAGVECYLSYIKERLNGDSL
jgi:hypothetical protein